MGRVVVTVVGLVSLLTACSSTAVTSQTLPIPTLPAGSSLPAVPTPVPTPTDTSTGASTSTTPVTVTTAPPKAQPPRTSTTAGTASSATTTSVTSGSSESIADPQSPNAPEDADAVYDDSPTAPFPPTLFAATSSATRPNSDDSGVTVIYAGSFGSGTAHHGDGGVIVEHQDADGSSTADWLLFDECGGPVVLRPAALTAELSALPVDCPSAELSTISILDADVVDRRILD